MKEINEAWFARLRLLAAGLLASANDKAITNTPEGDLLHSNIMHLAGYIDSMTL